MGTSFSSDQTTINMAVVGADTLARTGRARVTSIQGEGIAGSTIILYDSDDATAPGTAVATYNYNTEGIQLFIPGSGIVFKDGLCATLTQTAGVDGSVTMTITGA